MNLFKEKLDNDPALQSLPDDMKLEAFVIGVLAGLVSACCQSVEEKDYPAVVESIKAYLPFAADQALTSLQATERLN